MRDSEAYNELRKKQRGMVVVKILYQRQNMRNWNIRVKHDFENLIRAEMSV